MKPDLDIDELNNLMMDTAHKALNLAFASVGDDLRYRIKSISYQDQIDFWTKKLADLDSENQCDVIPAGIHRLSHTHCDLCDGYVAFTITEADDEPKTRTLTCPRCRNKFELYTKNLWLYSSIPES